MLLLERQLQRRRLALLHGWWRVLRGLGLSVAQLTYRITVASYIRSCALREYRAGYFSGDVALFRTEDPHFAGGGTPEDWRGLCAGLTVWPISGRHYAVFDAENIAKTKAAVLAALRHSAERFLTLRNNAD
jgi:thioesterase domain-containing protein